MNAIRVSSKHRKIKPLELIGSGVSRNVYSIENDDRHVIKIEDTTDKRFQNIMEWRTWKEFKDDPDVAIWLAPVIDISECGKYLIMEKTEPVEEDEMPDDIPEFIGDYKVSNMGRLSNGNIVCHDYGYIMYEITTLTENNN